MGIESRRTIHAGALIVALPLVLNGIVLAQARDKWDAPDEKWRQGPAKYLLSKEEDQAYKKMKSDEERTAFVESFWAKRDPSPGTPDNEYRDAYYRRAREAAERFSEDGGKGWQDERGRVYLLLGPPDEISESTASADSGIGSAASSGRPGADLGAAGTGSAIEAARKEAVFVYHTDPLTGKKGRVELRFQSDAAGGGSYRLVSPKLDWNQPMLKGLAPMARTAAPPPAPATPPPAAAPAAPAIPVPAEPAPAAAPEATPESDLLHALRSPEPPEATVPLDLTANFYKAADGSTFATLTLELKRTQLPASSDPEGLVLAAEFLKAEDGTSAQRFLKKGQFGGWEGNLSAGINDTLLYQAERALAPGKYKAFFAMKDPASGVIGKLEREIEVPDFTGDQFALSSVTLARKLEPVGATPAGEPHAFIRGNFRVVPRPDSLFKEGEELTFYYQIYGAAIDEVTRLPRVDLSYQFEKMQAGQWKMVGRGPALTPAQTQLVQAFGIPLRGWPGGDYRVVVKVTDAVASKTATAELPFSIQGPAGAGKAKAKSKS